MIAVPVSRSDRPQSGGRIGTGVQQSLSLIDIFPTISHLVGRDVDGLDGRSFTPLLDEREHSSFPVVSEDGSGQRAIRDGKWKYIEVTDPSTADSLDATLQEI